MKKKEGKKEERRLRLLKCVFRDIKLNLILISLCSIAELHVVLIKSYFYLTCRSICIRCTINQNLLIILLTVL